MAVSRPKNDFLTIPEENAFLKALADTKGDFEEAMKVIPHVDPACIDKDACLARIGMKPVAKPDPKKPIDPLK